MKTDARSPMWLAVAIVAAWDFVILAEISSFIRQSGFGGWCGTWALASLYRMLFFGVLSLIAACFAIHYYRVCRGVLHPSLRLVARLPLCCLAGLLAAYFIAIPALEMFAR